MEWIVIGTCVCGSGILYFIWALCRISAIADRRIEYMYWEKCGSCGGAGTIGDKLCHSCGGAGKGGE